jgi:hypothetical protein
MKECGRMIKEMGEALRDMQMETLILAISAWAKLMAKGFIRGRMGKYLMESGTKDLNMAMEFGKEYMKIHSLASGISQKLTDLEFTLGQTVISTKVCGIMD